MVETSRPDMMRSAPQWAGAGAGLLVAAVAALMPGATLEALVSGSGIAALLPVAAPPLGVTARAVLALGGGVAVAAVVWAALYLLVGPGGLLAPRARAAGVPVVRRADAHPDAPPRWPLTATELPEPPVAADLPPIEAALPADLDMPLALYDPDALPPVPAPPVRALKPLAPGLAPGERLETYTLTPPPPPAPAPRARGDEPPSIDALLRRLEEGARRRVAGAH